MSREDLKKLIEVAPDLKGEALKDYAELAITVCENQIQINPVGKKNWVAFKQIWEKTLEKAKKQIDNESTN